MTKAVAVAVALLLVCSLPAMFVVGATERASQPSSDALATGAVADDHHENTTSRLSLPGETESEYPSTSPDFAATLGADDTALRDEQNRYRVDHEWASLTNQERVDLLETVSADSLERVETLEREEQAAIDAYLAGELDDRALIRTLVQIDHEAGSLAETLATLESRGEPVAGFSTEELEGAMAELDTRQGPVRELAAQRLYGVDDEPRTTLSTVGTDGVVLSTIDGSQYLREASQFDNRDRSLSPVLESNRDGLDAAAELYPWVFDGQDAHPRTDTSYFGSHQLIFIDVRHPQGQLLTYLDTGTADPFREVQRLSLDSLPTHPVDETWENDSIALSVNETPHDGPIELTVTDPETGEPVDADVRIDGAEVGETGDDGTLWLPVPPTVYELTVESDDATIDATLDGG